MVDPDDDFVGHALPIADQPGAGDRSVVGTPPAHIVLAAVELLAELFQTLDRFALEAPVCQFLDAIRETRLQEPAVEWRWLLLEQVLLHLLEFGSVGGSEGGHTGHDGVSHGGSPW